MCFICVTCGDTYLWVADPRQVTFICSRKEKSPKENAPRSARKLPPFLTPPGARPTRRARSTRLGLKHGLARKLPVGLRYSARATGARKHQLSPPTAAQLTIAREAP